MGSKVSIIIPVIRPDGAKKCIELIKKNAGIPETDYEIIMEEDINRIGCPKMVSKLTKKTKYDWVCFLGDDTLPQKDFLKNALEHRDRLKDGWGLISLNTQRFDDLGNIRQGYSQHWLAHKECLKYLENNEFFYTGYIHNYCDEELVEIIKDLGGHYIWVLSAIVHHNAPIQVTKHDGEYYRIKQTFLTDKRLYLWRRAKRLVGRPPKIGILLPITDQQVYTQFMLSFLTMEKPNYTLCVPKTRDKIDKIRNQLVEQALLEGCTHIIFMDTDQVYPSDAIVKLLNHDVNFVGGVIHRRYPPFDPLIYWNRPEEQKKVKKGKYSSVPSKFAYSGEMIKVRATGCGCICFKVECLTKVKYPWFVTVEDDGEEGTTGEDIYFCQQLIDKGETLWVDTSVQISHLSLFEVTKGMFNLYSKVKGVEMAPPTTSEYLEMVGDSAFFAEKRAVV